MKLNANTLALALLRRWRVDNALVGDLLEQRTRGRSSLWLWRQILAVVFASSLARLRIGRGALLVAACSGITVLVVSASLEVFVNVLLVIGLATVLATIRLHWQFDHMSPDLLRSTTASR